MTLEDASNRLTISEDENFARRWLLGRVVNTPRPHRGAPRCWHRLYDWPNAQGVARFSWETP